MSNEEDPVSADITVTSVEIPELTEEEQRDRLLKSSKYIPKRLLNRIQQMEGEKAAVREVLQVLEVVY